MLTHQRALPKPNHQEPGELEELRHVSDAFVFDALAENHDREFRVVRTIQVTLTRFSVVLVFIPLIYFAVRGCGLFTRNVHGFPFLLAACVTLAIRTRPPSCRPCEDGDVFAVRWQTFCFLWAQCI